MSDSENIIQQPNVMEVNQPRINAREVVPSSTGNTQDTKKLQQQDEQALKRMLSGESGPKDNPDFVKNDEPKGTDESESD